MISSASSLAAASLITFGVLSTNSLASFKPRPVISRTTLITLIFCAPALVSSTSNSVFSAAASPAPPATATGAAAVTPNSSSIAFTKSLSSNTVIDLTASMICSLVIVNILP
ncbi:50S ribosomal protein L7/L12 [Bacillus thuringiensis HD-789]|uniref:50S ribosomal protein L7/L12 n=1 Tax=Bacillus thuringiensis HD-789 TaxID=1217737 RepID=A0A9W3JTR0_BACTU|nr:50S ribosomal protein L7/L12 [Bacillus thuringiensis HD-789]AHZ48872.1 50S ribosomal protein L7/L12 [Bacillus thuringiensis serovar kurstaki str. YBT-1520]AIE31234.1 50S ribosomal protein L7/L12 [Bacillus thuringiensis serovar kurstaki str. HD-1]EJT18685.1 50S ribosomal protein L7/L12 [Bacillus anthracis str. UR-1]ETT80663.1 50S ribosomal protein L7/L12 [Bacillus cereus]